MYRTARLWSSRRAHTTATASTSTSIASIAASSLTSRSGLRSWPQLNAPCSSSFELEKALRRGYRSGWRKVESPSKHRNQRLAESKPSKALASGARNGFDNDEQGDIPSSAEAPQQSCLECSLPDRCDTTARTESIQGRPAEHRYKTLHLTSHGEDSHSEIHSQETSSLTEVSEQPMQEKAPILRGAVRRPLVEGHGYPEHWYRDAQLLQTRKNLSIYNPLASSDKSSLKVAKPGMGFFNSSDRSFERKAIAYFIPRIFPFLETMEDVDRIPETTRADLLAYIRRLDPAGRRLDFDTLCELSWILNAPPEVAVERAYNFPARAKEKKPIFLWAVLQILRSRDMSNYTIAQLLSYIRLNKRHWDWKGDSILILTMRLLRHARTSQSGLSLNIVGLYRQLLPNRFLLDLDNKRDHARLTVWCNDILRFLSLPSTPNPFGNVLNHQRAQLYLLAFMTTQRLEVRWGELPLTRLGYRSLYRLQLMHAKTPAEAAWTRAQRPKWPPWEDKDRMGLDAPDQSFKDRRSRAIKVMDRMQTAGYALTTSDLAHRVLAGRDTDNSPTLQVRRSSLILDRSPSPVLTERAITEAFYSPRLWLARIEATRTIREAWMCFCSFVDTSQFQHKRALSVYRVMAWKLMYMQEPSKDDTIAGNSRAVMPEPRSPRDLAYIPREIPTVIGFVNAMVEETFDFINGKFLTSLLTYCTNHNFGYEFGLWCIAHTVPSGGWKTDVLTRFEDYAVEEAAEAIQKIPGYILESYLAWHQACASSSQKKEVAKIDMIILAIARGKQGIVLLESLDTLAKRHYQNKNFTAREAWESAAAVLDTASLGALTPFILRPLAKITQSVLLDNPPDIAISRHMEYLKRNFIRIYGGSSMTWLEFCCTSEHMQNLSFQLPQDLVGAMFWAFVADMNRHSLLDAVAMTVWLHRHRHQLTDNGSWRNLAVIKIVLEGLWTRESSPVSRVMPFSTAQKAVIARICEGIGFFPTNVDGYLDHQYVQYFTARLRAKLKHVVQHDEGLSRGEVVKFNETFDTITASVRSPSVRSTSHD